MRGSRTGAGIVGIMDMDPTGSTGGLKDSLSSRYLCSVLWLTTEFKLKMNACLGKPAASQACEHTNTQTLFQGQQERPWSLRLQTSTEGLGVTLCWHSVTPAAAPAPGEAPSPAIPIQLLAGPAHRARACFVSREKSINASGLKMCF